MTEATKRYTGTKTLQATPMTRGDYSKYRGWDVPENEDPTDAGYLVEYEDGGKANDSRHAGYISWSPSDVFQKAYSEIAEAVDAKPAFDVCIYITNVAGTLEFEGHVNPDRPLEAIDQCALQFTSFVAAQLPMLMQMAATAAQPSLLLDADGVQIEST